MPESPPAGAGALVDMLKHLTPYAPGFAGALFSMAFGERLTIRGKLLSAAAGLASAYWLAPFLCDVLDLFWPGDGLPASLPPLVGFTCGVFGMIFLAGIAQALAKYSKDPLSLVRIKFGPVEIGSGGSAVAGSDVGGAS